MKSKINKIQFVCSECGQTYGRWQGQCTDCKSWNTIHEETTRVAKTNPAAKNNRQNWAGDGTKLKKLSEVKKQDKQVKIDTGFKEFNRVLGGGIQPGSILLLGGDPGIGKSTLLLQATANIGAENITLYVTGEESLEQVSDRCERLNLNSDNIFALAESQLEEIIRNLEELKPTFAIIDSIQSIYSENLPSASGTVSQIKECATVLTRIAKQMGISIILIGHVTKDGDLAGPRVLEHIVDASLFFEGNEDSPYRFIRAFKNRFGPCDEVGAFEMSEQGLISVDNPSAMFLSMDRSTEIGSAVFVAMEGKRPMLMEIQTLVQETNFGNPRRVAVGVDYNRLTMLLAVLQNRSGLATYNKDVYLNAVGGAKIRETSADLSMCLSIISSIGQIYLPSSLACFGEVGLTGEIRPVIRAEERIKEAQKMGFKNIIIPLRNKPKNEIQGIKIHPVKNLKEAYALLNQMSGK